MSSCLNDNDKFTSPEFNALMDCWNNACCSTNGSSDSGHHEESSSFDFTAMMHYHSYLAITSFEGESCAVSSDEM